MPAGEQPSLRGPAAPGAVLTEHSMRDMLGSPGSQLEGSLKVRCHCVIKSTAEGGDILPWAVGVRRPLPSLAPPPPLA